MRVLASFFLVLTLPLVASATEYYVDAANSAGPWLGSMMFPYRYIADALALESGGSYTITSGDTILVNSGVYPQPLEIVTVNTNGTGAPRDVRIIGDGPTKPIIGSATPGNPSFLSGPALWIHGGQSSACLIKDLAIQGWESGVSRSAAFIEAHSSNIGSSPTFESVDFSMNRISGQTGLFFSMGGAMLIHSYCNPTLLLCEFTNNRAGTSNGSGLYGGAIGIGAQRISETYPTFLANSMPRPVISSCTFTNNETTCRGGAIAISAGSPIISDCEFRGNVAADGGGAIFCKMTDGLRVEGCRFYGNAAVNGALEPSVGGAILASWTVDDDHNEATAPDPIRIIGNEFGSLNPANPGNSGSMAGAVLIANADCTVSHNRFLGNEAKGLSLFGLTIGRAAALAIVGIDTQAPGTVGEAMSVTIDPNADVLVDARVVNNLFAENFFGPAALASDQDVIWMQTSDDDPAYAIELQAIFVNNTVTSHGFAAVLAEGELKAEFQNNILWDPPINPQIAINGMAAISTNDNDSNQALGGLGDISLDPLFVLPPGNLYLGSGSPCIHTGDSNAWLKVRAQDPSIPNRDLDGGIRIVGSAIDMGCEEYVAPVFGP